VLRPWNTVLGVCGCVYSARLTDVTNLEMDLNGVGDRCPRRTGGAEAQPTRVAGAGSSTSDSSGSSALSAQCSAQRSLSRVRAAPRGTGGAGAPARASLVALQVPAGCLHRKDGLSGRCGPQARSHRGAVAVIGGEGGRCPRTCCTGYSGPCRLAGRALCSAARTIGRF
jgi:hypothetical protein